MATSKLNPKTVLTLGKSVYTHCNNIMTNNKNVYAGLKNLVSGNTGGKPYWEGKRAFSWFCSATRNCCNNYYRVYKVTEFFDKLCENAAKLNNKDNGDYSTTHSLTQYETYFESMKKSAEKQYNAVLTWAKQ